MTAIRFVRDTWPLWFAIMFFVFCFSSMAIAGGDDVRVTQSNDMNNQTTGDVSTNMVGGDTSMVGGENKSLALVAPSLGDVDIAACLGSTQWSFLIMGKQKLELNHICMAEFYLNNGLYKLAAQSMCNQKEILAEYDDEATCEAAHDFGPIVVEQPDAEPPEELAMVASESHERDDEETHHEEQFLAAQVEIATAKQELASVERRLYELETTNREKEIVEIPSGLTENQRNELAKVLEQ